MRPRSKPRQTRSKARVSQPLNAHRAARAAMALSAYVGGDTEEDEPRDVLCDLVADLGHHCDVERIDFEALLDMALIHWRAEREEVQS